MPACHAGDRGFDSRLDRHLKNGKWLSLVEHLVWDQGVAGSNPVVPIDKPKFVKDDRGVAQLARASGSYPGGRGFDPPCRDRLEKRTFSSVG